jgi:hypothetical protein
LAAIVGRAEIAITAAGERASLRFLEFFAATIRNPHTPPAHGRVVAWIEQQTREHAAPTVKLRLAALRHLFEEGLWKREGIGRPCS